MKFNPGLNVVMAEIRLPENRKKDTHNLWKTTLGRLLDFFFLSKRDRNLFLFKHEKLFDHFVFFLEVECEDASFITVRRSVGCATKIAFKRHKTGDKDFSTLLRSEWDHWDVTFDDARQLLHDLLGWRMLKDWSYRKVLGYLLRSQENFSKVFELSHSVVKHADWKPFLAHLLGFDGKCAAEYYKKIQELESKKKEAELLRKTWGRSLDSLEEIETTELRKQDEVNKKQALLDTFDFHAQDPALTEELVDTVDERIAALNARRYSMRSHWKRVKTSLQEGQILFCPDEAQVLFDEVGVLFEGQIKKDFEHLIAFNRAITAERHDYLQEELAEIEGALKEVNAELDDLGKRRAEGLAFLTNRGVFTKYQTLCNEIIALRGEIAFLEYQREPLRKLHALDQYIGTLKHECIDLEERINTDVQQQCSEKKSLFASIGRYFKEMIREVIDCYGSLRVTTNKHGHLEFHAEITDAAGKPTSADLGNTYRRLMCIAFDLAVLRAYLNDPFPRFVYHDGVFESLDDRKKENLLRVIRQYASFGIQSVITLIDSDLPERSVKDLPVFSADEIVLTLHDEGESGRLFKMQSW
ncbi:DUF2326 domain-containing protein [Xylella fastidiosa subsp. pauca]|uniref:DUF2326 domain-containing protein n=1 Tax=Xylella fastidiosa TaxID=2371 RepID=UPI00249E39F8|nr:DUF2326 domain-containing protein [Xylella fastidiosa]WGZ36762.1 DUF2326 domain-containing protein [Xylella fastidiosa subsp. pauca]